MLFEIIIILLLILTNGVFAMSELSVVSARKNRLQLKAENGNAGAASAFQLAENPNRFLSTVQIGITLIGILNGAFGGATIAEKIGVELNKVALLAPYSEGIGVGIVVLVITYLSLVLGELVPKRLALNSAEQIAIAVAPLMQFISKITTPVVSFLSGSTNFIVRLLGVRPSNEPEVTEADLRSMLDQGTEIGVFEESEQDMVVRIFRLSDRAISSLITPRVDIIFLDINASHEEIHSKIARNPFSRFPVFQGTQDNVIGIVRARDLLLQRVEGSTYDIHKVLQQPLFVPEPSGVLKVLEQFKLTGAEIAVVIDEYGGVLGMVSMNDILVAIVGDMATPEGVNIGEAMRREDGSWLFDGMIQIDELKDHLDIDELPYEDEGSYETLSGFMMSQLGRVPATGDYFEWDHLRFEIVDMDGRRVDKVLVSPTN